MGNTSFLTGSGNSSPGSIKESIFQLENCSVIFLNAWQRTPPDIARASRASDEAMTHLDHVVNEILGVRDDLKSKNAYSGSQLEMHLNLDRAKIASPVTRVQQQALITEGAGNGTLPVPNSPLKMEHLLNKIKHRRRDLSNFRIEPLGEHIFVISVDKPSHQPDSIVEFTVRDFCTYCSAIAQLI